jgi:hypothetical protein
MNIRDKFKRKAILMSNHENDWLKIKTARNKVNIELRNAKKNIIPRK